MRHDLMLLLAWPACCTMACSGDAGAGAGGQSATGGAAGAGLGGAPNLGGGPGVDAGGSTSDSGGAAGTAGSVASGGDAGSAASGGSGGASGSAGSSSWPLPSACDEGSQSATCADGVAEASCPSQITFFAQTADDTATSYWEMAKPKGGFRMASKFAGGQAYLRMVVTKKPTDIEIFPQVCAWRWDPAAECKDRWKVFAETCSSSAFGYATNGTYYLSLGPPQKWWQKASPAWDYARPFDSLRILQKATQGNSKYLLQDTGCGTACWPVPGGAAAHLPLSIDAEFVLVAAGSTFKKPAHWTGCNQSWCQ